ILGFANFVADGENKILLPVSSSDNIVISSKLTSFSLGHGIASDPVNENLSDELAEAYDQEEVNSRLSDPVFASLIDDEEQDDE
ncbi:hypothetical protein LC612_34090, partial [Nostoc sp. CHAB 5834]|nr:hypothetical protein [Nostoc sp. CHAB 5834]